MEAVELNLDVLKSLHHTEVQKRREAILALGQSQDPHVFRILAGFFFDSHPSIRDALFQAFTRNGTRWAAEIAADALLAPQLSVRSLAMDILRQIGQEAVWPLKRLARSSNPDVRKIVAEILGSLDHPVSRETLLRLLSDQDENVVFAAIESLGNLREIAAVPLIVQKLQSGETVRAAVTDSLLSIFAHWEKKLVPPENLESVFDFSHLAFLLGVQRAGCAFAINYVVHLLVQVQELPVRLEALKALGAILDQNPQIQLSPDMLDPLLELEEQAQSNLPEREWMAVLKRIPSPRVLQRLVQQCTANSPSEECLNSLFEFCQRFSTLFLGHYLEIPQPLRLKILQWLDAQKHAVCAPELFQVLDQISHRQEMRYLLWIGVRSGRERILPYLENAFYKKQLPENEFYRLILFCNHAHFIPQYINALYARDSQLANQARQILPQFGQKSIRALLDYCSGAPVSAWKRIVWAVSAFPYPDAWLFWQNFLQDGLLRRRRFVRRLIQENPHWEQNALILLAVWSREADFHQLLTFLKKKGISIQISKEFWAFAESVDPNASQFFQNLFKVQPNSFDNQSSRDHTGDSPLFDLFSKDENVNNGTHRSGLQA